MSDSRNTAFGILLRVEQDKAFSNIALNNELKRERLNALDSAFVSALVYGVLEREILLDHIIKQYSKIPLWKIEIKTKIILRMGVLQLLFMDKVPQSAAVNESVRLAKKHKLMKSAGFINGVLRNITGAEVKYTLPDISDKAAYYSVKYSIPKDIAALWINSYGELNAEALMQAALGRPKISVRVNTLKTDAASLSRALESQGVGCSRFEALQNALLLSRTGSLEELDAFKNGLFHVQDLSSQLCAELLKPQPRHIVLDVCSAPGGKAFTMAQMMNDRGRIFACDLYDHKLRLIEAGAKRLGITCVSAVKRDAALGVPALPRADRILCDVPCSGLGILSRKPEIKCKAGLLDSSLPALQYKILCKSSELLAAGGRLVYSTCTLNPKENNENTRRFLSEHPGFRGVELKLPTGIERAIEEQPYEITLMPHTAGTDGFYIAVFERKGAD